MKKTSLLFALIAILFGFYSCNPDKKNIQYKDMVGTWGAEKIQYYNTDYWGNPIASSIVTYTLDPYDADNSIRLVFNSNRTGAFLDSNVDTVWYNFNSETGLYESYVVNPDTILVHNFTCSFDTEDQALYLNMEESAIIYKLDITEFEDNFFVFEEEYGKDYVEKAFMRRITDTNEKGRTSGTKTRVPRKPGSLFYSTPSTNPLR